METRSRAAGVPPESRSRRRRMILMLACIAAAGAPGCRTQYALQVSHRPPSSSSARLYEVLELSFGHHEPYRNPFLAADLTVDFTGPDGRVRRHKGFYYGNNTWMVRIRPGMPGPWKYSYRFQARRGVATGEGAFTCTAAESEGPVRQDPVNPFRWIYANGKPYYPLGIQDCYEHTGDQPGVFSIDGESRTDNKARRLPAAEYLSLYGRSGFNLLRFSQRNCSYPLFNRLDHYNEAASLATDRLLATAREHGFRIMFGFFGYHAQWDDGSYLSKLISHLRALTRTTEEAVDRPGESSVIEAEKRFIAYAVARWGVYADFWELLNERKASDEWTRTMAAYVRSIDPDRKPVTTSWEKPWLAEIGVNAPHWYERENELESDLRVMKMADQWKQFGKPVIVGEQGNTGMNWDPKSALRLRIRAWTALCNEIALVFWNTSWSKYGMYEGHDSPGNVANIYLGAEERRYTRILAAFASRLPAGMRMTRPEVSGPATVRAYGLVSSTAAAAYLHHAESHATPARGVRITLEVPPGKGLVARWIDPATGNETEALPLSPAGDAFDVPPFTVDLALLITPRAR